MFESIERVSSPPAKPTMVWDGECGFCKYWISVWQSKTGDKLQYKKYQDVYERFQSIPLILKTLKL